MLRTLGMAALLAIFAVHPAMADDPGIIRIDPYIGLDRIAPANPGERLRSIGTERENENRRPGSIPEDATKDLDDERSFGFPGDRDSDDSFLRRHRDIGLEKRSKER